LRIIKLFVSSPADVAPERERVAAVVARLNSTYHSLVQFQSVRWEDHYFKADRPFQEQIPESAACDIVVSIFWTRIGAALPADFRHMPDGRPYPSGTAYELLTAIEASKQNGTPDVYVFRKAADAILPTTDLEGRRQAEAQHHALEAFWDEWFNTKSGQFMRAWQTFATTDEFEQQLEQLLRQWLAANELMPRSEAVSAASSDVWRFIDEPPAIEAVTEAGRKAASYIGKLSASRRDICDLACLASIAVQIEPYLLRQLRLRFIPDSDASLEADLAFSELANITTGSFVELASGYLAPLRGRLAESGWLDEARALIADAHRYLSAAIQLEEEAIYLTVRQPANWRRQVSVLLGRAAKAAENRDNVARWAHRALQELPPAVRETEGYWILAKSSSGRIGSSPPTGAIPAGVFSKISGVVGNGPTIEVGVVRDRDDLLLAIPPSEDGFVLSAPLTQPIALVVTTADRVHRVVLDAQSGAAFSKLPAAARGAVRVETLAGDIFELPEPATAPPQAPAFERERDRHLFGPGPKSILALDGGVMRHIVTIAFLERIEALLSQQAGVPVRLADHFDLVGGTSIGALLSAAIALGLSALRDLYLGLVPRLAAGSLNEAIQVIAAERELDSPELVTGLAIVMKRIDIAQPWIVANNPRAPHWSAPDGIRASQNLKLSTLLEASVAKLNLFEPQKIQLGEGGPVGFFVNAGASPYNNPALALFRMATRRSHGINWPANPDQLSILSIGCGSYRHRMTYQDLGMTRFVQLAEYSISSLAADAELLMLAQLQWLGESPQSWAINSEIGSLDRDELLGGKRFRFLRYDLRLETEWIKQVLGLTISARDVERFRNDKDPSVVVDLYSIAKIAAEKQVHIEHFVKG
jgi:uncharacterized protein